MKLFKYLFVLFVILLFSVGNVEAQRMYTYGNSIGTETNGDNFSVNATFGSDLITWNESAWNEDDSTWTMVTTGPLTHVTGNTTAVTGTVTGDLTVGGTYAVNFVGTGGTATATYTLGGVTGTTIAASGAIDFTDYITVGSNTELVITPANTCTVALTLVSVKLLTDATGDLTVDGNLVARSPATFWGNIGIGITPVTGTRITLPVDGDAVTPVFAFGDGDSGFYQGSDNKIEVSIGGTELWRWYAGRTGGIATFSPNINVSASSVTVPVYTFLTDEDTGLGLAAANQPAVISGSVPSQVWGTTVTLTTAQINAIRATPIALVAAKGANTIIELVSAVLTYDYATAAFTVGADEDLVIEYANGTDATASIETAGFLDQVDDEVRYYQNVIADGADLEATINQGLQIKNTGTGETADGGGEVDVRLVYRVYATGF